jgi:hypothetical protein
VLDRFFCESDNLANETTRIEQHREIRMQHVPIRWLVALPLILGALSGCSGDASPSRGDDTASLTGGTPASGGNFASSTSLAGGATAQGTGTAAGGRSTFGGTRATGGSTAVCGDASLVWKSGNNTNYTSYPDPGSEECIKYNGCTWAGQFAACDGTKSEDWVAAHNIVSAFPDFRSLQLHDLCLRKEQKVIVVTVLDTCADGDCSGCCTENRGSADELIDIESYTDAKWGVPDGPIEWADLGPTKGSGCD